MTVLLVIKEQIYRQEEDLNIRSQDLNQPVASHGVAMRAVRKWTNRNHAKQEESITELKQAKELISGPSARRTEDLLKLNRPIKMGSRTIHRTLQFKRTPFQIGTGR
jgi:hypothetical protein